MGERIKGTLSLPKRPKSAPSTSGRKTEHEAAPQVAQPRGALQPNGAQPQGAQPQGTQPQGARPEGASPRESSQETEAQGAAAPRDAGSSGTQADAERLLSPEEIASFRERYGLEPEEFDEIYRAARVRAPQYGIDYAVDVAALKARCASLKELIRSGDAPSRRAGLLAQALLTYGAMATARDAASKRKP